MQQLKHKPFHFDKGINLAVNLEDLDITRCIITE